MTNIEPSGVEGKKPYQIVGLLAGPIIGLLIANFFEPAGVSPEAIKVAAIASWMAIWWATEATNVAVTSLLPLITFPMFGVSNMASTSSAYANPIIFLFFGGFVMAIALEKSKLHLRVAMTIFEYSGVQARSLVASVMIAAAFISMWVSNTSTTLMMLPIIISITHVVRQNMTDLSPSTLDNFDKSMFLGLAYGATLGGIATLVGTPPNVFMAGFMETTYGVEVDFARWMIIGVPLMIIMLPIVWFLLTSVVFPVRFSGSSEIKKHIVEQKKSLGSLTTVEIRTGLLFFTLVAAWILRKPIAKITGIEQLSDAMIAVMAAIAAFIIPAGNKGRALLEWEDTKFLPWGVLLLFGGGLALAGGLTTSGLTQWLGGQLAPLGMANTTLLIIAACALVIFITELTSNTATTATFLPVIAGLAVETGQNVLVLIVPITLAASFAFMLPVATPPNAIVFSSGRVSIPEMMRAGVVLNIISVFVLTLFAITFVPIVFG